MYGWPPHSDRPNTQISVACTVPSEHGLRVIDYLSFLNAALTVFSVVVAFRTLRLLFASNKTADLAVQQQEKAAEAASAATQLASEALSEQVAAPQRERRYAAYYALVATPTMELLPETMRTAIEGLRLGSQRIEAQLTDGGAAKDEYSQVLNSFRETLWPLIHRVGVGAHAWGDPALRAALESKLACLEDAANTKLVLFLAGKGDAAKMIEDLRAAEGELLSLVVHYDPTTAP